MICPHCGNEIDTNNHMTNFAYGQLNVAGAAQPAWQGTYIPNLICAVNPFPNSFPAQPNVNLWLNNGCATQNVGTFIKF